MWGVVLPENRRSSPGGKYIPVYPCYRGSICWAVDNKIPCILQVWTYHIISYRSSKSFTVAYILLRRRSFYDTIHTRESGDTALYVNYHLIGSYLYVGGSFGAPTYHIIPTYMVPLIHRFFPMVRFKSTSTCSLEHPDICREEWIDTYISYQSRGDATAERRPYCLFFLFPLFFFYQVRYPILVSS